MQFNMIFFFDCAIKHRTQGGTSKLCASDKIRYLENEWKSVPLCPSCRVPSKISAVRQPISTKDLLTETLIRESKLSNNNSFNVISPDFDMIPQDFLILLNSIQEKIKPTEDDTKTWIAFGKWLGFEEVITKRHVYQHLKGKWKKFQHAIKLRETNNLEVPSIIKKKEEKKQIIISARKSNFNQFRYVTTPECIVDQDNRTLAHLEKLDDYNAIIQATDAINSYYNHILADKSHGSKDFLNNFTEHFGAYARYNMLPYTSSNTASSHNILHVNNLLHNL